MKRIKNKKLWITAGVGALVALRAIQRKRNAYSFSGKVVLITGASRGLGLVMARKLAEEGAKLAICARSIYDLDRAKEDLQSRGAQVLAVPCNLRIEEEVKHMVKEVENEYGRIDVLINNAGIIQVGPLENQTVNDFREAMDTHYWAPLYTMLATLPGMKDRKEGRIVNISSVGGKVSLPHMIPYSGSKFALVGLSEGFRAELKKYNVLVTTINPFLTRTGSARNATIKGQHEKEYAWFTTLDLLPLVTMSAEKAAESIINACRHGDAEVTLGVLGKLATAIHGLAPGFVGDYFALIDHLLPKAGETNESKLGSESQSDKTPGWIEARNEKVGEENNEI
ncbi:SDR family NAD(P)-dependent oxidoreductase [Adhaeribacter aquaticus]|uniref:SDR family NAD(P)-dependent oxidoreductase n=1 Tax=Adhaeribacter aquaticus TaxID=299567 RepID=UPI00041641F1|nr:SDR family oxidoreductase [Adhaeribacter aquaticus]